MEDVTGKYVVREREVGSASVSYDASAARRLWEVRKNYQVPERCE
jgi:hypothetical protein